MTIKDINLAEKLAMFDNHWDPHVVAIIIGNPNSGDSDRPAASKPSI